MSEEIKEILDNLAFVNEDMMWCDKITLNKKQSQLLLDYITNLQQENERLKEWKKDLLNENIELENIRKEAINIYDNRNSLKYKKQRFMQGKTTADLMYEALQNGSDSQ